jgi:ADP-heptose:LPS heptosyltransferase
MGTRGGGVTGATLLTAPGSAQEEAQDVDERHGLQPSDRGRFDDVRTVGVLVASGIGDFVAAVPALRALRAAYPHARIVVLGDVWHPGLLTGRPGPWDDAVPVPRTAGIARLDRDPGGRLRQFVQTHCGRYDLIVQLQGGGAQSNAVVLSLGARHTVGAWAPGAEELDRCVRYVPGRPEVLRCLEVVELAGGRPAPGTRGLVPSLAVTDHDLEQAHQAWPDTGLFVLLHPGARDARRCWPVERFAEAGVRLSHAFGSRILVVGAEPDRVLAGDLTRRLGANAVDLTGRLSLGGLLGLARRCLLFVGNDSGPRHLAVAAGAPTLGLFLPSNVRTFGPLVGARDRVVASRTVGCPTCGRTEACDHLVSWLEDVSVDEVVDTCEELVEDAGRLLPVGGGAESEPSSSPRVTS